MITDLSVLCISPEDSLHQAIAHIDQNRGIVLVTDFEHRLLATITDGDVRRAILAGEKLTAPVSNLLERKKQPPYHPPITASVGTTREALLRLMQERTVRQIPLITTEGRVAGLVMLDELLPSQILPLQAVIMAGGFGTRLYPLTEHLPKPMLPVGDRPLMELILERLQQAGIRQVNVTTHYLPDKIKNHFGDGQAFGVNLNYVSEDRPLGTAGALGLMQMPQEPLLVINGDILTKVDFRAMLVFHQEHQADLTIGVRKYDLNVPYGVVESDGVWVQKLVEKPLLSFFVNAGIYLLDPSVHHDIPRGERFDMTDLIQHLLTQGRRVVNFPILEYWLDIGQPADYQQAQEDFKEGKFQK